MSGANLDLFKCAGLWELSINISKACAPEEDKKIYILTPWWILVSSA